MENQLEEQVYMRWGQPFDSGFFWPGNISTNRNSDSLGSNGCKGNASNSSKNRNTGTCSTQRIDSWLWVQGGVFRCVRFCV